MKKGSAKKKAKAKKGATARTGRKATPARPRKPSAPKGRASAADAPKKGRAVRAKASGRYASILRTFKDRSILVVGDLIVDKYVWGDVSRISPEAPVPVVKVVGETLGLGGSANVVANIKTLGGTVIPIGIVGNDPDGERIVKELVERNIETKYILKHPTRRTTTKTRIMARNQQVVRIDREETGPISSTLENALAGNVHSLLDDVDGVVVSDYGKGIVTPGLMRRLVQECRGAKRMLFVDPKLPNYREYEGCTAITPNHNEAASFLGTIPDSFDRLLGIGKEIQRTLRCEAVLVTRGRDGMTVFMESGGVHSIPAVAREVFDVTGAGDTVIAAFALAASSGANWLEAATIANFAAGVVIGKLGAATLSIEELTKGMGELIER